MPPTRRPWPHPSRPRAIPAGLCALALALGGCGPERLPPGELVLLEGQESDLWTATPTPTTVELAKWVDGERTVLRTEVAPATRLTLDEEGVGAYEVALLDAGGAVVGRGRTLLADPLGFAASELGVFVARTAGFARPPGGLGHAVERPILAATLGRLLLVGGAPLDGAVAVDAYDLGIWNGAGFSLHLPCESPCRLHALALVDAGLGLALVDGGALALDVVTGSGGPLEVPTGLGAWSALHGARALPTGDGGALLLAGTRSDGEPSTTALHLDPAGELTVASLSGARRGAAATLVTAQGVVVVGGSTEAAGAEVFAPGSTAATPLPFPPDATEGAGLVSLEAGAVVRVGGTLAGAPAPTVRLALGCAAGCTVEEIAPPAGLTGCTAHAVEGRLVVVGTDTDGATRALSLDATGAFHEVPFRIPRSDATAFSLATGHVAIAGGTDTAGGTLGGLELFLP